MNKKYSDEIKLNVIEQYHEGKAVAMLSKEFSVPKSSIYYWLNNDSIEEPTNSPSIKYLQSKIVRLETMIEFLQRVTCSPQAPLREKLYEMEKYHGEYAVHLMCDAMNVARGTFYNHVFRNKKEDSYYSKRKVFLRERIKEVFEENNGIFGAGKITAILREEGIPLTKEMTLSLMQEMGLKSLRQSSKKLYRKENSVKTNVLNRDFFANGVNQKWVSDITYFKLKNKTYYICVIIDLFSRKVISYRISQKNSTQLTKKTFQYAFEHREPNGELVFHNDRGSNYCSNTFCDYLQSLEVKQSFSKTHTPYDNAVSESFFSTMKREELYRAKYKSEREFKQAVSDYITFYNEKRPHKYLNYKTPTQFEKESIQIGKFSSKRSALN